MPPRSAARYLSQMRPAGRVAETEAVKLGAFLIEEAVSNDLLDGVVVRPTVGVQVDHAY